MIHAKKVAPLLLAVLGAGLAGCSMNDNKGVEGVFPPTPIQSPPSVRGVSGQAQDKPKAKPTTDARSGNLSVPSQ